MSIEKDVEKELRSRGYLPEREKPAAAGGITPPPTGSNILKWGAIGAALLIMLRRGR